MHRAAHAYEFDARVFVPDGSITLVFAEPGHLWTGRLCSVPAGTMHEEHTEAPGVRYVSGRRYASQPAPAR